MAGREFADEISLRRLMLRTYRYLPRTTYAITKPPNHLLQEAPYTLSLLCVLDRSEAEIYHKPVVVDI